MKNQEATSTNLLAMFLALSVLLLWTSAAMGQGADQDGDGVLDSVDNCPAVANADQANLDGDAFGDVCDSDRDGDFVPNTFDLFPDDPNEFADNDDDGVGDNSDNCLGDANPGQENIDGDLLGDECDPD